MVENNLTTTARAVSRSAFGINIKNPDDETQNITRKPDEKGVVDLSDLSTAPKVEPISVGEQIGLIESGSVNSWIYRSADNEQVFRLNKVSTDGANLPNGIAVKYIQTVLTGNVNGKPAGTNVALEDFLDIAVTPISPDANGISDFSDNGFTIEKRAIPNLIGKTVSFDFKFKPSYSASFSAVDKNSNKLYGKITEIVLSIKLEVVEEELLIHSQFIGDGDGDYLKIPINDITAY